MKSDITSIIGGTQQELLAMPWEEYKEFPGLNCSTICKGQKSMLHLKHQWESNSKSTDAMQYGRLLHCMLFEPDQVDNLYWEFEGRRAGKKYDELRIRAEVAGAEVVKADGSYSMEVAIEAAQGFLRNPRVKELILAGQAEQTVLTTEGDIQCKGRLDWISTSEHVLTDLKTTADIQAGPFGSTFYKFDYDIKLGMYRRWLDRVTGDHWPVEIIVMESSPPYDVAVMPLPDAVLDAGVERGLELIANVRRSIEADEWMGVAGGEPWPLAIPGWKMREYEENEPTDVNWRE
jgi:hypothetical protein